MNSILEYNTPFIAPSLELPPINVSQYKYLRMMVFSNTQMQIIFEWSITKDPPDIPGSQNVFLDGFTVCPVNSNSCPRIVVRSDWLRIKFRIVDQIANPLTNFHFSLSGRLYNRSDGVYIDSAENELRQSMLESYRVIGEAERSSGSSEKRGSGIKSHIPGLRSNKKVENKLPDVLLKGSMLYCDDTNHLTLIPKAINENSVLIWRGGRPEWAVL